MLIVFKYATEYYVALSSIDNPKEGLHALFFKILECSMLSIIFLS
jgi:hypothetical protein